MHPGTPHAPTSQPSCHGPCKSEAGWRDISRQRVQQLLPSCPQAHARMVFESCCIQIECRGCSDLKKKKNANKQCCGDARCSPLAESCDCPPGGGDGDPVATLSSRQDRKGVPGCGATLPPGEGPTVPQMQEAKAHIRVLLRHLLDLGFMINVDKGMLAPAQDVAFWYYPWTR